MDTSFLQRLYDIRRSGMESYYRAAVLYRSLCLWEQADAFEAEFWSIANGQPQ